VSVVWVCGEGPLDHGRPNVDGQDGALPPLVRQILGPDVRLVPRPTKARKHGTFGRDRASRAMDKAVRGLPGNAWRLANLLLDARREEVVGAVFVHDLDDNGRKAHEHALQQLEQARNRAAELGAPPSAIGVAVPMVEAWLLADPQPFESRDVRLAGLSKPEKQLRRRGGKRYAKDVLRAHLDRAGLPATSEGYGTIAAEVDLDRVAERCPVGFEPFLTELRALRDQLPTPASG